MDDPYRVLGVAPGASWAEVRAAYRRLAKALHPDLGAAAAGGTDMARVNAAFRQLRALRDQPPHTTPPTPTRGRGGDDPSAAAAPAGPAAFVLDALRAEAFEALLIVASWLGDPWVVDEPSLLEIRLDDPARCFCRLELVSVAGGSIATLHLEPLDRQLCPRPEVVRDRFIEELNRLAASG